MRRRLSRLTALVPALAVGAAAALGLGEIDVSSRLNQRFVASIPLYDVTAEDLANLRVGIASNAEFERAGLERPAFLSSLRFEVKTDGRPRIAISSDEAALEPVLTLLLNVSEGSSRVTREYTVLLDPPDYRAPGADSTRFYETAAESQRSPAPAALPPAPPPAPRPAIAPEPAVTPAPASSPRQPAMDEASSTAQPGTYGPVGQETLWSIATRLRPPAATMDQMLLALYRSNPQAFDRGINGLLRGAVLTVPSAEEVLSVSAAAAREEVMRLRGEPRAAAATATSRAVPTPAPTAIVTPTPTLAPTPTPIPTPTPLPVATPEPTPAALPAAEPTAEIAVPAPVESEAQEALTPAPAEGDEWIEESSADPVPTAVPDVAEEEYVESLPVRPTPSSSLAGSLLIPLVLGLLVLGGIGFLVMRLLARRRQGAAALPPAGSSRLAARKTVAAKPAAAAAAAAPPLAKAAPRNELAELEALQATLEAEAAVNGEDTAQFAAAQFEHVALDNAGAVRTERFATARFDAAQTQAPSAAENVDFDLTGQFASQTVQINLDANDPLSEADFHLAYGLYDEAALLLRQAIEREPGRGDLRLKLAETYFAAGKSAEFQAYAETLKSQLSPADWQKIAIMGQQLVPGAPLFAPDGGADAAGGDVDVDLDLGAEVIAAPAPAAADPGGLDFVLDDLQTPSVAAPELRVAAVDKGEALEFDLSEFDLAPAEALEAPVPEPAKDSGSVDFDLDLSGFDTPSAVGAGTAASAGADAPATGEIRLDDIDLGDAGFGERVGGFDAAATKLDLARAYVDMGDNEMARALLDEVLAQGNEQQKTDARALIDRLG